MLEGYDIAWGGNDQLPMGFRISPPVAREESRNSQLSYPNPENNCDIRCGIQSNHIYGTAGTDRRSD